LNSVERVLTDPGFGNDTGAPDAALNSALLAWQREDGPPGPVLAALLTARVLVPIVAILAEAEADGREKSTDMAVVTLRGADGRVALPAFSSLDRLTSWHAQARPLPITAPRAAQAALFENADVLVLDPAGPVPFVVTGRALRALADGRVPQPPAEDPEVAAALRVRLRARPEIVAAALVPGDELSGPDAVLALAIDPTRCPDPGPLAHQLSAELAADPVLRDRLDRGLDLAIVPPTALPTGRLLLDNLLGSSGC
jgi:type III secretion system (T3SS) SseB-like protein